VYLAHLGAPKSPHQFSLSMGLFFSYGACCGAGVGNSEQELDMFTACNNAFPVFEQLDKQAICFNLEAGDVQQKPDPYFQWQGTYCQLDKDGCPMHKSWQDGLKAIAKDEGVELVQKFCKTKLKDGDRVYYSPAKAKRWPLPGPDPSRPTNRENLLIKRQQHWMHVEVFADDRGQVAGREFPIVETKLLRRISYLFFSCHEQTVESRVAYPNDPSEAAWLWGSSLIRLFRSESAQRFSKRFVDKIPPFFEPVRFVPLESRETFIRTIASTPTAVITGATLAKDSSFASPFSSQIGTQIGKYLGEHADVTGVKVMVNGSMKGHLETMSADDDFSAGFEAQGNCTVASVKGLNMVQLHGNAWKIMSGIGYVLEEALGDFSNNAKEACVCAGALNPKSIVMASNGGPTVSQNLSRFLHLSSANRVFSINGMHGKGGMSGAAGSFPTTDESLDSAISELKKLVPGFFKDGDLKKGKALQDELLMKPLTLLNLSLNNSSSSKLCDKDLYYLKPGEKNTKVSPGITEEPHVSAYSRDAVSIIVQQVTAPKSCL